MQRTRPQGPGMSPQLPGGHGGRASAQRRSAFSDTPLPDVYDKAYWTAPEQELQYQPAALLAAGGALLEALFTTPLLDLRADLGGQSGYEGQAVAVENVLFGVTLDLFFDLRINGYVAAGPINYRFFAFEFGSAVDPRLGETQRLLTDAIFSAPVDITLQVNQGQVTLAPAGDFRSILRFTPSGPLRYWGLGFLVGIYNNAAAQRSVRLSGALH